MIFPITSADILAKKKKQMPAARGFLVGKTSFTQFSPSRYLWRRRTLISSVAALTEKNAQNEMNNLFFGWRKMLHKLRTI